MNKFLNYIPLILIVILLIIINDMGLLNLSPLIKNINNNLFNIITVNSVFAGFLFTSITFFVGVSNTKTIETFERINYMQKIYDNLINGFISSMISILLCVFSIFITPQLNKIAYVDNSSFFQWILITIIPILILSFLLHTIFNFMKAINHVKKIIESIRRKINKKAPTKESVDNTLKQIK